MRNFDNWFNNFTVTINNPSYFLDYEKINKNIDKISDKIILLSSLKNSKDIKNDFINLYNKDKSILEIIPILFSTRESIINVIDDDNVLCSLNFKKANYPIEKYCWFMEESNIFDILKNSSSLKDTIFGIEIGLDSNARKNRGGHQMEELLESYIKKLKLPYDKEIKLSELENKYNIDLSKISVNGNTEKRFDFSVYKNGTLYAFETNFYNSGGSKLNETARSYKNIALESKKIDNFKFIWITDGLGWKSAKNNLKETFLVLEDLYNIEDLRNNILQKIIK